jgi:hypothetical protein
MLATNQPLDQMIYVSHVYNQRITVLVNPNDACLQKSHWHFDNYIRAFWR